MRPSSFHRPPDSPKHILSYEPALSLYLTVRTAVDATPNPCPRRPSFGTPPCLAEPSPDKAGGKEPLLSRHCSAVLPAR